METKEVGFTRQYETAVAVIEQAKSLVVKTAQDFEIAKDKLASIRDIEKDLDTQYKNHPVIIEAKRLQAIKGDLAEMLENARKGLKNGAMLKYEQAMEAERQAMERKLQAEAKAKADAQFAKEQAERRAEWERQEKARIAADEKVHAAKSIAAKAQAAEEARVAAEAAERIRQDAIAAKQEQAQAITPVVVVERTAPSVSRRMVPKFKIVDPMKLPRQYLKPDEVAIGGVIRSLRQNANIPGVSYYEEAA